MEGLSMQKNRHSLFLCLLLFSFILLLSSCGNMAESQGGSQAPATINPDQVQIEITGFSPANDKPSLTLTDKARVQKLYALINALPAMPENSVCTAEGGPAYQLIFQQVNQRLAPMEAQRSGCKPITIGREKGSRQTSPEFWQLLDQAIYYATPLAQVQSIAIQQTQLTNLTAQTARLTSATTAQKFYEAILALPQLKVEDEVCYSSTQLDYHLVLQTAKQAIPVCLSTKQNRITIEGAQKVRGGTYAINQQFRQIWQSIMASVTFAPARPDHLLIKLDNRNQRSDILVHDILLRDALYNKTLTLPAAAVPKDCPSGEDKIANKQVFYQLQFTQWNLPVRIIEAYEGSCKEVENQTVGQYTGEEGTGHFYTADAAFWTMLHKARGIE